MTIQAGNIQRQLDKGARLEQYKGLKIVTSEEGGRYSWQVYWDTASAPVKNYFTTSEERRKLSIQESKDAYDRNAEYKAKTKANKTLSTAANCAAAIRAELKEAFPNVKFTVKSSNFSMGNSVHIGWTDGPTTEMVESHTDKYQYGHFDGMNDLYENSNTRDDIPQAKYVSASRTMGEETRKVLDAAAVELWDGDGWQGERDQNQNVYRIYQKTAIPVGAKVTGIIPTAKGCGLIEEVYTIAFEGGEVEKIAPVETPKGSIQIIEYSAASIAVIGETYVRREQLGKRGLGGVFNKRLSCGPGWIFAKSRLDEITKALAAPKVEETEEITPLLLEQTNISPLKAEIIRTIDWFEKTGTPAEEIAEMRRVQQVDVVEAAYNLAV